MKTIIAATLLVTACATTTRSLPESSPTLTGAKLALDTRADTTTSRFPALVSDASLPSAARSQAALLAIRDRFDFAVNVCVSPDGSVAKAELDGTTGAPELDSAAQTDIQHWRFAPYAAPASIRVCKKLAIAYRPAVAVGAR